MTQTTSLTTTPQSTNQPPTMSHPSDPLTDMLALLRLTQIIQKVLKTISTLSLPTPKPENSPRLPYATIASTNKSPLGPRSIPLKYSSLPPSLCHPPAITNSMSQTDTPTFMGHSKQLKTNSKPFSTPPSHTPQHAPAQTKKTKGSSSLKSPQPDPIQSSAKEKNHQYI